ncbi:MAG: transposase [Acidobacteriales bacterium]|nr:transposase [Terriglobales bacterium]
MTIVTATLNKLSSLAKPQRKFVAALVATILALRGRFNYRNLARYGNYSERTYARQFGRSFPWLEYHAKMIQSGLPPAHELIAAQDASFIPKSGKKTYGLDKFYNGSASRPERGLEISALAIVDVTQKGAYVASVAQTPSTPELQKEQADATRLDQAIRQMQAARPHLPTVVRYLAADGWYAKKKYIDAVIEEGLHPVTKLRSDANMRFRYTGGPTGKQGRPKIYDGKVGWQDLSRFDKVDLSTLSLEEDSGIEVYTAELYHVTLKRWTRTVVLVWHTADGKRHHAILATTDLNCTAADVLRMYQARFQLEFLFRDGKQQAGLTECQARNKEALDFHFNVSLATVSAARAAAVAEHTGDEPFVFSLATQKQLAFNEHFMAEISTKLGDDLSCWKKHPAYEELRTYGALAT